MTAFHHHDDLVVLVATGGRVWLAHVFVRDEAGELVETVPGIVEETRVG